MTLLTLLLGVVIGAIVFYLFLRANPKVKSKVDDAVHDLSDKLKK